jgi:hypothetical protein
MLRDAREGALFEEGAGCDGGVYYSRKSLLRLRLVGPELTLLRLIIRRVRLASRLLVVNPSDRSGVLDSGLARLVVVASSAALLVPLQGFLLQLCNASFLSRLLRDVIVLASVEPVELVPEAAGVDIRVVALIPTPCFVPLMLTPTLIASLSPSRVSLAVRLRWVAVARRLVVISAVVLSSTVDGRGRDGLAGRGKARCRLITIARVAVLEQRCLPVSPHFGAI